MEWIWIVMDDSAGAQNWARGIVGLFSSEEALLKKYPGASLAGPHAPGGDGKHSYAGFPLDHEIHPNLTKSEAWDSIGRLVTEAKKDKKKKKTESEDSPVPDSVGYRSSEVHDYSRPLGDANLYKRQGAANFGPWTEAAIAVFSGDAGKKEDK